VPDVYISVVIETIGLQTCLELQYRCLLRRFSLEVCDEFLNLVPEYIGYLGTCGNTGFACALVGYHLINTQCPQSHLA